MPECDFSNVSVAVFDPVAGNLNSSRQSLSALGFSAVETAASIGRLERVLTTSSIDLLIAETSGAGGDIEALVRKIRVGDFGDNPFLVVLLTVWTASHDVIRAAMGAGADDVLIRPYSPAALSTRLNALVRARKPFVVTGDYIGPDRRSSPRPGASAKLIEAPNTFKAAAENDVEALQRFESEITNSRENVTRERMRRLAMRVSTAARLRLEAGARADAFGFEDVDRSARELRRRLKQGGAAEADPIASALCTITGTILAEGEANDEQLTMVRDLPMAAYAMYAGAEDADASNAEVSDVVRRLQSRLAAGGATAA